MDLLLSEANAMRTVLSNANKSATRSPHARTRAEASAQNRYERFLSLHYLSRSLAPREVHPESAHGRSKARDGPTVFRKQHLWTGGALLQLFYNEVSYVAKIRKGSKNAS